MREEKEKKRLLVLKEREDKIMKECSFKPNIQTSNQKDQAQMKGVKNNFNIDGIGSNQMT